MGPPIKLKLSEEKGHVPQPGQLILGELAVNAADGRLYLKRLDGVVVCVGQVQGSAAAAERSEFDPAGTASSAIANHEAKADPHPAYALKSALGTAANWNVEHFDPMGAASSAMAGHLAVDNPHSQYALLSQLGSAAAYSATAFEVTGAGDAAVTAHEGKADPHAQYEKKTALGTAAYQPSTAFDAAGAATSAVATHEGKADPHAQYEKKTALGTAAYQASTAFATAAQGVKADSALQAASWASPGAIGATTPNTGVFSGLTVNASDPTFTLNASLNGRSLTFRPATGSIDVGNASLSFNRYSAQAVSIGTNSDSRLKIGQGNYSYAPYALLEVANTIAGIPALLALIPSGATANPIQVNSSTGAVAMAVTPSGGLILTGPCKLPSYTVATLPSASANSGSIAYCSNDSLGATPVFSDGTNWRRVHDRMVTA